MHYKQGLKAPRREKEVRISDLEMYTRMEVVEPELSFDSLPMEVKLSVFDKLDLKSLSLCAQVKREWRELLRDNSLWKKVCKRDFRAFMETAPLPSAETPVDKPTLDILHKLYTPSSPLQIHQNISWRAFYRHCMKAVDLNGIWTGMYGFHGNEDVRIFQNGFNVVALKLQGDSSVPAGEITWKGTLHMDKKSGRGLIQCAGSNFQNPRWEMMTFTVEQDKIVVTLHVWIATKRHDLSIRFHRDRYRQFKMYQKVPQPYARFPMFLDINTKAYT